MARASQQRARTSPPIVGQTRSTASGLGCANPHGRCAHAIPRRAGRGAGPLRTRTRCRRCHRNHGTFHQVVICRHHRDGCRQAAPSRLSERIVAIRGQAPPRPFRSPSRWRPGRRSRPTCQGGVMQAPQVSSNSLASRTSTTAPVAQGFGLGLRPDTVKGLAGEPSPREPRQGSQCAPPSACSSSTRSVYASTLVGASALPLLRR
jgi:ribosomal protein S14